MSLTTLTTNNGLITWDTSEYVKFHGKIKPYEENNYHVTIEGVSGIHVYRFDSKGYSVDMTVFGTWKEAKAQVVEFLSHDVGVKSAYVTLNP